MKMKKSNRNVETYSSENEESYSTYSEDFDNESRSTSPSLGKGNSRYNKTRTKDKSDLSDKSFTTTSKYSVISDNRIKKPKKSAGNAKHGWRPSSLHKGSKKAFVVRDSVQARMLSARQNRINCLNNELGEAKVKVDELKKENRLLKTLQHRQDKALRRFEDTESDLPRLIAQHTEEQRILKARLRKNQDNERMLENKIKDDNEEMLKMANTLKRLKKIVYDKNLGERSQLSQQLAVAEDKLYDLERQNKELEKRLELTTSSYTRQLNAERSKHKSTKERLEVLHEEYLSVQTKLREKERALDVSNIYALRSKQSPEKSFVSNKVAIPSPRRIADKPANQKMELFDRNYEIYKLNQIPQSPPTTDQKPLALENHPKTPPSHIKLQVNGNTHSRQTAKSPIVTSLPDSGREDSPLLDLNADVKVNDLAKRLNGLRTEENNPPKDLEPKKSKSVFLTANFESPAITPGSTFISDQSPQQLPAKIPTPPSKPKEKEIVKPLDSSKEIEAEQAQKKMEENRRKKADLLAKMRNLEEDGSSILPSNSKNEMKKLLNGNKTKKQDNCETPKRCGIPTPRKKTKQIKQISPKKIEEQDIVNVHQVPQTVYQKFNALDSPGRSKRQYRFPIEVENLHLGIPSTGDLTKEKSDPEISFGGYAPSVAVPPKRKARTTVAPKKVVANESDDEPLFDLDSGKNKKNDLLAQLFGEQAAKPDLDKKEKSFEKNQQASNMPRAKPVHSGYPWERNVVPAPKENGDSKHRATATDMIVSPVIKSVASFNDEDIEELVL